MLMKDLIPKFDLNEGEYALICSEIVSGILVRSDGKRPINSQLVHIIYNSLPEATKFAEKRVIEIPELEVSIYDHTNKVVDVIRNKHYGSLLRESKVRKRLRW
jgi:hypothetical protein